MILSPKETAQHLDVSLLRAWTKPSRSTIKSQMAKARQQIVVTFSAEGSGGQPFGGSDERLDAHFGVPIGFSRWLSKTAVRLREVIGDKQQIINRLFSEDHRPRSDHGRQHQESTNAGPSAAGGHGKGNRHLLI